MLVGLPWLLTILYNIPWRLHFEIHFTYLENYTCLHSQCKIVKYQRSARTRFKKGVNLVIIWGFLYFVFWKKELHNKDTHVNEIFQRQPPEVFYSDLKNFAKFTEKQAGVSFIKIAALRPVTLDSNTVAFQWTLRKFQDHLSY